jgi:hypothetical protein
MAMSLPKLTPTVCKNGILEMCGTPSRCCVSRGRVPADSADYQDLSMSAARITTRNG